MGVRQYRTIARFTCVEALRSRLWLFAIILVLMIVAGAEFAASLAITESAAYRLVIYAACTRFVAVFILALFVAASVLREFADKGVELVLSRPVSRADWYVGRFMGFASVAVAVAALMSVPLLFFEPDAAAIWAGSLALELMIIVAASLAATITVRQLPIALTVVAGFYLLSRSIAAIALISTGPTVNTSSALSYYLATAVDLLSHILPDLDRFSRSSWLLYELPDPNEIAYILTQSAVYVVLLITVGLFDLYRRNF